MPEFTIGYAYFKTIRLLLTNIQDEILTGFWLLLLLQLIPNVVSYENFTAINGDHIGVSEDTKMFLAGRGHELKAVSGGAIVQLIVQSFKEEKEEEMIIETGRKIGKKSKPSKGLLTAVCDPRKDGKPAAV